MIMCVLLCYPLSIHMSQLLLTGRPISSFHLCLLAIFFLFLPSILGEVDGYIYIMFPNLHHTQIIISGHHLASVVAS